jgi:hypothetical protein
MAGMMTRIAALAALVLLTSCAPMTIWHRAGVSVAQMERDADSCRVAALRDAPVATQVVQAPPVFVPPRQVCNAQGACVTQGGYFIPGEISTVDPNAALRARLTDRCMADRGYAPVSIPLCPTGVASAAPPGRTTILPAITERSCVIRQSDGSWQIVNRG